MTILNEKWVTIRKEHHCWGCTTLYPIGSRMLIITTAGQYKITTIYWCSICDKFLQNMDTWDGPYAYGELLEYDDYPKTKGAV